MTSLPRKEVKVEAGMEKTRTSVINDRSEASGRCSAIPQGKTLDVKRSRLGVEGNRKVAESIIDPGVERMVRD